MQSADRIAPDDPLDMLPRTFRDQRGRNDITAVAELDNLAVEPMAGRPGLVAEMQALIFALQLTHKSLYGSRRRLTANRRREVRLVVDGFAQSPNVDDPSIDRGWRSSLLFQIVRSRRMRVDDPLDLQPVFKPWNAIRLRYSAGCRRHATRVISQQGVADVWTDSAFFPGAGVACRQWLFAQ
ncbi:hypothetical protein [Mesorhizobium shangrilense]|uniref:hypothetical protein n=1 Tax=Mesorhizobium shangrilense TaxID=460060 RepID=UPI003F49A8B9